MKKGILGLALCTLVAVLLFVPNKVFAGHDMGILSKDTPYLEAEISLTKDDLHPCFFRIAEEVDTIGLYVKNLSGGGSAVEYFLCDADWKSIQEYELEADTIAIEGDVFIPVSEFYGIDFLNISYTGMDELKLGICVYCPAFGGKASDYSRYNDFSQEYSEKKKEQTADKVKLTLSETAVTLEKGKSLKLKATLAKNYKKKGVTWKSSDTTVAKVSKKGKITAKGYGTAVITCTSKKTKKVTATCTVTVVKKGSGNTGTTGTSTSGSLSGVSITLGHGGDNASIIYRYISGIMVGADGYYTLSTNDYSGELTLDFETSDGIDSRKMTVEKNSTYYLTYTYGINKISDTVIYNPPQQIMSGIDPITGMPRYVTLPGSETRIPAVASNISIDVSIQGGRKVENSINVAGTVKKGSFTYEKK